MSESLIYAADYLVSLEGPPLRRGALRIEGNRIVETGSLEDLTSRRADEVRFFPESILLPGLINAHCHLELGLARGLLPRSDAFSLWVARLRKFLQGMQGGDYRTAVQLGVSECLKNGITTVVDVGNTGEAWKYLLGAPIRSFAFLEVLGLNPDLALPSLPLRADVLRAQGRGEAFKCRLGLTPHAPYSSAPEVFRETLRLGRDFGLHPTFHLAESQEEELLFREGRGGLFEFCRRIFPAAEAVWEKVRAERKTVAAGGDEGGSAALAYLRALDLLPQRPLLVHGNTLGERDLPALRAAEASVVHCPKSHDFFHHPPFPLEACLREGINLCLGTDSLASNDSLNLFDEMAELKAAHPSLPGEALLRMGTGNPARALGREGDLGSLGPGKLADFIAIGLRHHEGYDIHEEIVTEGHEVMLCVVDGEEVVR